MASKKLNIVSPSQAFECARLLPSDRNFKFKYIKHLYSIWRPTFYKFHKKPDFINPDLEAKLLLGDHVLTQGVVRMTRENYLRAVLKFDFERVHPTDDPLWFIATQYVIMLLQMYIPRRKPCYSGLDMDWSTNPGYPLNRWFKTIGEVPLWLLQIFLPHVYGHIWQLAMKRENLPLTKIHDNKMRSFMMPSKPFLIQQKIYSQNFNQDTMKVPWFAYGFNYHCLGFHRLISYIAEFPHVKELDVSFWDKHFGLKRWCYEIQECFLDLTYEERTHYWQMAEEEITPTVLLPTNEVVQFQVGQCSGSESTTVHNCIAHLGIIIFNILWYFRSINVAIPPLSHIMANNRYKLYSDDNLSSHSDSYKFLLDGQFNDDSYRRFGMEVEYEDPTKFRVSNTVVGATFLGLTVGVDEGKFVPLFDYEKVKDASVLKQAQESSQEQVIRFLGLLDLLVFTPYYEEYRQFIFTYCDRCGIDPPLIETQEMRKNYELCKEGGGGK